MIHVSPKLANENENFFQSLTHQKSGTRSVGKQLVRKRPSSNISIQKLYSHTHTLEKREARKEQKAIENEIIKEKKMKPTIT